MKHLIALVLFGVGAVLALVGRSYALACISAGLFVAAL